jgi:hypothetical protein
MQMQCVDVYITHGSVQKKCRDKNRYMYLQLLHPLNSSEVNHVRSLNMVETILLRFQNGLQSKLILQRLDCPPFLSRRIHRQR